MRGKDWEQIYEPMQTGKKRDTQEYGKMSRREDGKLKGKKKKSHQGIMAQKELWNIAKKRMLDRGAFPREDGDLLREYQAMQEENLLSSWLWEDAEGKKEERAKMNKEVKGSA